MSIYAFLAPQQVKKPSSALPRQLMTSESRTSSLNVPALESSLSWTALPSTIDTTYDSSAPLSVDPESPEAIFTALLGSSQIKRVERLSSVVRGFSKGFSDGFDERLSAWHNFWSEREVGYEGGSIPGTFELEVSRRLHRLKQARYRIRNRDWVARRLWLIFLVHEVEYISQWEHIELYTSRGVDPMSAALKMATKYLYTAKGDYKRGKNIVRVMKEGGPASVLEDGGLAQSM